MRAVFQPHDHAWLAQFGASLPTSRTEAVRGRLLDAARFVGAALLVAFATVGALHMLDAVAPQLAGWLYTVLAIVAHAAWAAVS